MQGYRCDLKGLYYTNFVWIIPNNFYKGGLVDKNLLLHHAASFKFIIAMEKKVFLSQNVVWFQNLKQLWKNQIK